MTRWMRHLSDEGGADIPPERFKFETRVKVRGTSIAIYTFKEWQTRLYGGYDGTSSLFWLTVIDTKKKQNKANPACLERAAKLLWELTQ